MWKKFICLLSSTHFDMQYSCANRRVKMHVCGLIAGCNYKGNV